MRMTKQKLTTEQIETLAMLDELGSRLPNYPPDHKKLVASMKDMVIRFNFMPREKPLALLRGVALTHAVCGDGEGEE
jgi:hypothetical protein